MPGPNPSPKTKDKIVGKNKYGYDESKIPEEQLNPNEIYRRKLRNEMYTNWDPQIQEKSAQSLMNNFLGLPIRAMSRDPSYGTDAYSYAGFNNPLKSGNRLTGPSGETYDRISAQYPTAAARTGGSYELHDNKPDIFYQLLNKNMPLLNGLYNPLSNRVGIQPREDQLDVGATIAHEFSHAMGSKDLEGNLPTMGSPISSYDIGDAYRIANQNKGRDINLSNNPDVSIQTFPARPKKR